MSITSQINTYNIKLTADKLNRHLNDFIANTIKNTYEGKCSNYGFILKDSITILDKSDGQFEIINNIFYTNYKVKCKLKLFNPVEGDEIFCTVNSKTQVGIILYLNDEYYDGLTVTSIDDSPIIVIVPSTNIDSDTINNLNIHEKKKIKITACRKKKNTSNIQVIGKII